MNANLNGLPDEATLARLASEFFAALPGEAASLDGRPGAAAPAAPQAAVGPAGDNRRSPGRRHAGLTGG